MPIVTTQDGLLVGADAVLARLLVLAVDLRLYKNPVNVESDSVLADFDECDFPGYPGPTTLTFFGPVFLNDDGKAQFSWNPVAFVAGEILFLQEVHGYIVVDSGNDTVLWGERLSPKIVVKNSGQRFALQSGLAYASQF